MKKTYNTRAEAASQKTSAHRNKRTNNCHSTASGSKVDRLVEQLYSHGVPDDAIKNVLDVILDIGNLNVSAMIVVLNQVTSFLEGKLPKPAENMIVNITVISIMEHILSACDEDDSDNYRTHNNKSINKKK